MSTFRYIYTFFIIIIMLMSCSPQHEFARAQRKQEKELEERYKEYEKHLEVARKRHFKMQTPETQERMEETKRKSESWHLRNQPFYKRWYLAIVALF